MKLKKTRKQSGGQFLPSMEQYKELSDYISGVLNSGYDNAYRYIYGYSPASDANAVTIYDPRHPNVLSQLSYIDRLKLALGDAKNFAVDNPLAAAAAAGGLGLSAYGLYNLVGPSKKLKKPTKRTRKTTLA
jgi:hypothetical protein